MTPQRALVAVALVSCLLGCSLSQTIPERRRFSLASVRPGEPEPACAGWLMVHRFRVVPLFERKGFSIRTSDESYDNRFYDEFAAPPGVLLRRVTFDWLDRSEMFRGLLEPGDPGAYDFVLEGRAHKLYADLRGGGAWAVLELQLALLEAGPLDAVFDRRYGASIEAASASPEDLVIAWEQALARALTAFEADLRLFLADREECGAKPGETTLPASPGPDSER